MPRVDRDAYDEYMREYMRKRRAEQREQRAKEQAQKKRKKQHIDEGEEFEIIELPDGSVKRIPIKKKEDEILGCNMWHED